MPCVCAAAGHKEPTTCYWYKFPPCQCRRLAIASWSRSPIAFFLPACVHTLVCTTDITYATVNVIKRSSRNGPADFQTTSRQPAAIMLIVKV